VISGQKPLPEGEQGPRPQIRRGTGQVINLQAASAAPPALPATGGGATFNFEGESLQAVVKVILGDMLGQNYVIAPGIQGTVTLSTSKPVSPASALVLLETVLTENNARMVYSGGLYHIVPADQALASGTVALRTTAPSLARGYEVRTVPLRYISATEMEKILKPYARPSAVVSVDNARNIINIAGTRAELENYVRTIEIFDVDWLSGMSVGVFPLTRGKVNKVVADLEKVFGEQSKSPVAGMFRFMPLEDANAVMVITPQPSYLDDIQEWLDRIDSAGGDFQLYSYELKYINAKELATRLVQVLGTEGSTVTALPEIGQATTQDDESNKQAEMGSGHSNIPTERGSYSPQSGDTGEASVAGIGRIKVSAIDDTNSIIVRCMPSEWKPIKDVIAQLDVMPLQVQIEAQVATVQLSGALSYGVNWFFEKAVTDAGLPDVSGRTTWSQLSGAITSTGMSWTFLGREAAAVISALDAVADVQLLQTPSVVVRNNAEATLNVGSRIPVSTVTVNPTAGGSDTISQVQYLDTGTILKVRPRISRDGMVFLDIDQEISSPTGQPDANGNVRIDTQKLRTEAAIQSGDTVLLAGLINDGVSRGGSGFPGLSRIPVIGGLFGRQSSSTQRSETIVLITPTIIRNSQDSRDLTDEYGQRFRALRPLPAKLRKFDRR
jgi:general secretion pathway protein D